MNTHRAHPEQVVENGRKEMLTGMLLHVIEPAAPVDLPLNLCRGESTRQKVSNAGLFVDDVDDGYSV